MIYEFGKRKKKKKFLDTFLNILFFYLLKYSVSLFVKIFLYFNSILYLIFLKDISFYLLKKIHCISILLKNLFLSNYP